MGPGAWFYEAKKLEAEVSEGRKSSREAGPSIDFLYRLAFAFGQGAEAKEAGKILVQRAIQSGDKSGAYSLAVSWIEAFGPDMEMYAQGAAAALGAGMPAGAVELVGQARKNLAAAARSRANELSYYEYSARSALGDQAWAEQAWNLLGSPSLDSWGAKILGLALGLEPTDSGAPTARSELARMRIAFQAKDYASATRFAVSAKDLILAPGAPRHFVSEAGRSFVNAKDTSGIAFFASRFPLAQPASASLPAPVTDSGSGTLPESPPRAEEADRVADELSARYEDGLWIAAYYLARLWQLAGWDAPAAALFLSLTEKAPSDADSDGALWYWLDITLKLIARGSRDDIGAFALVLDPGIAVVPDDPQSPNLDPAERRPFEFAALVEASSRWKNPSSFDDLLDGYCRSLLKGKAWNDALALTGLLGAKLSTSLKPRFSYLGARLVEEGLASRLVSGPWGEDAAAFFRSSYAAIAEDAGAEE
ncbi:MAG TPA: hypothetical protein VIO60_08570, partial [Rectinemataceae bacterium]